MFWVDSAPNNAMWWLVQHFSYQVPAFAKEEEKKKSGRHLSHISISHMSCLVCLDLELLRVLEYRNSLFWVLLFLSLSLPLSLSLSL